MPGLQLLPRLERAKSHRDKERTEGDSLDGSLEADSHSMKFHTGQLNECVKSAVKKFPVAGVQSSLKREILLLEKKLQEQLVVRHALEKALGGKSSVDVDNQISVPKPTTELIEDIGVLELEVLHLEQYLLSLYRKAFHQQISSFSPLRKDEGIKPDLNPPKGKHPELEASKPDSISKRENVDILSICHSSTPQKDSHVVGIEEKLLVPSVHRCHSSLSYGKPQADPLAKALLVSHSQPLPLTEYPQNVSSHVISLAEHLGTRISDLIVETPNRFSEDMVKCMSAIYYKLADPSSINHSLASPYSSLSSMSAFSPQDQFDMLSPGFNKDSSFDVRLENLFNVGGLKEFSGPYSTMFEVSCLYRDSPKSGEIEHLIQNFRNLLCRLEELDPKKMKHEEKLAFWINIHNALVMHTFLAYGIPQNNVKRVFLLLKAAYNVGGQTISADTIQSSILRCRMSRPGQWLRSLLSPRTKFKASNERQAYGIEKSEPLVHFALCSGSHSDPVVRVYTPQRVLQELKAAKEEYVRATFGVRKDRRILLPKLVDSYAKDLGLCQGGVAEMVQQFLPESLSKSIGKCQADRSQKSVEWVPHNFAFRYLIAKELVT